MFAHFFTAASERDDHILATVISFAILSRLRDPPVNNARLAGASGSGKDWTAAVTDSQQVRDGQPLGPVRYFWPAVLPRNLLFLIVVLLHGFRRLAPPY